MITLQNRIRCLAAGTLALSLGLGMGMTAPATSAPSYDGLWSVVIITDSGSCDRAYRYPVRIAGGQMINEGSSPVTINGRVGGNGSVTVTVSHAGKNATGSGRLRGAEGAGSWRGGECSGTWEAERRGA